jgi:hypothetical protein
MYAKVLLESPDEQAITQYVNESLLVREWSMLRIPGYVREAWEQNHPGLRNP